MSDATSYVLDMNADMSKSSVHHKMAAAAAPPLVKHILDYAPAGAHVHVPVAIPAGDYVAGLSTRPDGQGRFTLTPGTHPGPKS